MQVEFFRERPDLNEGDQWMSFALARAIHVIAVLFWIGGVGFVTWVVMPAIRANEAPADRLSRFQQIEGRAWRARFWVLLAGLTGLWLIHRADMWTRC